MPNIFFFLPAWAQVMAHLLAAYVCFCLGYYWLQNFLIFMPSRRLRQTPRDIDIEYEDVWFQSPGEIRLHGWFVPAGNSTAQGCVLFCHGNAGNISSRLDVCRAVQLLGYDLFIFDYRGFGRSQKLRPREAGVYADALAAWDYLEKIRRIPAGRIAVFGQSLGCAMAARVAASRPAAALILEGGFSSLPEVAAGQWPFLPARLLMRSRFDTADEVNKIACPVLIAHSPQDRNIGFKHAEKLFNAAHAPKQFARLRFGHVQALEKMPEEYLRILGRFLKTVKSS